MNSFQHHHESLSLFAVNNPRTGNILQKDLSRPFRSRVTKVSSKSREKIMNRKGQYFLLDKIQNRIEFGLTTELITKLTPKASRRVVEKFIGDESRVASMLWDPKLMKKIDKQTYRLQLKPLSFLTLSLSPSVDVIMWVEDKMLHVSSSNETLSESDKTPVFYLESIGFDPNIKILPGVGITPRSLNINIETVGSLQVTQDGEGLQGKIGFVTTGKLPGPFLLLPDQALKRASELISNTVKLFIVRTFEKSVINEFSNFFSEEKRKGLI